VGLVKLFAQNYIYIKDLKRKIYVASIVTFRNCRSPNKWEDLKSVVQLNIIIYNSSFISLDK